MAAGGALIDARGEGSHLGHTIGNLLSQQHAAATRLRSLADDHFDRIRLAQLIWCHAVARGEVLIDQCLGGLALFRCHAAITCRCAGAHCRRSEAERLFGVCAERTEAHSSDGYRNIELNRL